MILFKPSKENIENYPNKGLLYLVNSSAFPGLFVDSLRHRGFWCVFACVVKKSARVHHGHCNESAPQPNEGPKASCSDAGGARAPEVLRPASGCLPYLYVYDCAHVGMCVFLSACLLACVCEYIYVYTLLYLCMYMYPYIDMEKEKEKEKDKEKDKEKEKEKEREREIEIEIEMEIEIDIDIAIDI